jgi:hypothetical protein
MSATTSPETYQCSYCGGDRTPRASVKGSYCSTRCYELHERQTEARKILNQFERDHRFCASCFGQHKTVEPPDGKAVNIGPVRHKGRARMLSKNCLIGFQYATEKSDEGQRTRSVDEYGRERLTDYGPICECGNTRHYQTEPALRTRFAFEIGHTNLVDSLAVLREEEKTDAHIDEDVLDDALMGYLTTTGPFARVCDWGAVLAASLIL